MNWNINFDICSIAILLIMLFFNSYNSYNSYKKQTIVLHFRRMLLLTLLCGFLDIITGPILQLSSRFYYPVYFLLVLFFIVHIICTHYYYAFLFFHVSNNSTFEVHRFHILSIPFFLLELLTLSTPFTNALFILTPEGDYIRGWGMVILIPILIVYILFILWFTLSSKYNVSAFLKKCVLFFSIFIILCILYQTFISPRTHLLVFSLTVAELFLQFSLLNPKLIENAIQDEKDAKIQAQEQKHSAERAAEAKSNFLSSMSHEIRTPITSILGMNELILRESTETSILYYSKNIKRAGQALLSLINDILDFSKIETGKLELHPAEYRLDLLLYDLVNMFSFRAEAQKLTFQVDIARDLPKLLYGDETRIRQIVTNLLSNAVKYTPHGSVSLTIGATVLPERKINLNISVTDTGIGIRKEDQDKIFDSFNRAEEEKHRHIAGTGLGLSIVTQLVCLMNGEIHVESTYGKGSRFCVSLPQEIRSEEPIGDLSSRLDAEFHLNQEETISFLAPDARVLIVDDNAMNLEVISGLLKRNQLQITTATSGKECLTLIQNNYYHIILMDHLMSDMSGVQTLHEMRNQTQNLCKDTPVIVITADVVSGAKEYYFSEGFDDYLTKPVNIHDLESVLRRFLPEELVTDYNLEESLISHDKTKNISSSSLDDKLQPALGLFYNGNNTDQYCRLLSLFLEHAEEKQNLLSSLLQQKDLNEYRIQVHALKSNARSIGAEDLAEAAYKQEQYAAQEDMPHIVEYWPGLKSIFNLTLEEIRRYLNQVPIKETKEQKLSKKAIDTTELTSKLNELLQALVNYDNLLAMDILEELQEYELSSELADRLSPVCQAVNDIDYKDAISLLQQILKKE